MRPKVGSGRIRALILLVGLAGWLAPPALATAQGDCADELIDEVHRFRATQGLGSFTIDPVLMAVAGTQTQYRVATGGVFGHLGPSGERPRDRAIAAGYGAGWTVFISENIAEGTELTPAGAVEMWTMDDPHLNTMLGRYYRDIGAGCGFDGDYAYYTIMTGYVAGGYSASGYYGRTPWVTPVQAFVPEPFFIATPASDGSITHVVAAGQTLWTIAAYYDVSLDDLRRLNGFGENPILHPGDTVIVRLAAATATSTNIPPPADRQRTTTARGSPASPFARTATAATPPAPSPEEAAPDERARISQTLIGLGALLVVAGLLLAFRRASRRPPRGRS